MRVKEVSIGGASAVTPAEEERAGQRRGRRGLIGREGKGRLGIFNSDEPSILMTLFLLSMGE